VALGSVAGALALQTPVRRRRRRKRRRRRRRKALFAES